MNDPPWGPSAGELARGGANVVANAIGGSKRFEPLPARSRA